MAGSLPGKKTYSTGSPAQRSSFRDSWSQPEGVAGALVIEGTIVSINLVNWTVDVISKFDQKSYFGIQVSSPYMHFSQGEGVSVMPDVGCKCYVAIPSDGPPPFVLCFIMPMETISGASADAPSGTDGGKGGTTQESTAASFAGGRRRAKPGDISITGRDGQFVRLHRGGVLQIGASPLAQRIYIPLQNLVSDISQNYRHQNTGGSVNWFISPGESSDNPPTTARYTYRVLTNDAQATVRVAVGKVSDVFSEPDADVRSDLEQLGIGTDPVICEVTVAPDSISADDGAYTSKTSGASVLRYFFDKKGNTLLRTNASLALCLGKRLRIRAKDDVDVFGKKNFFASFDGAARIEAKGGIDISGGVVRLNAGTKPVASVGSLVQLVIPPPGVPITVIVSGVPSPGTILAGATVTGLVINGNPTILV